MKFNRPTINPADGTPARPGNAGEIMTMVDHLANRPSLCSFDGTKQRVNPSVWTPDVDFVPTAFGFKCQSITGSGSAPAVRLLVVANEIMPSTEVEGLTSVGQIFWVPVAGVSTLAAGIPMDVEVLTAAGATALTVALMVKGIGMEE